jgi:hypothetical protein
MKNWQGAGFFVDSVERHWKLHLRINTRIGAGMLVVALPISKGIKK